MVAVGQRISHLGKPYKVISITNGKAYLKCLVCTGKHIYVDIDKLKG